MAEAAAGVNGTVGWADGGGRGHPGVGGGGRLVRGGEAVLLGRSQAASSGPSSHQTSASPSAPAARRRASASRSGRPPPAATRAAMCSAAGGGGAPAAPGRHAGDLERLLERLERLVLPAERRGGAAGGHGHPEEGVALSSSRSC